MLNGVLHSDTPEPLFPFLQTSSSTSVTCGSTSGDCPTKWLYPGCLGFTSPYSGLWPMIAGWGSLKAPLSCLRLEQAWGIIYTTEFLWGIRLELPSVAFGLKLHPCFASSSFLSCFPHSLTSFSLRHFLNKSIAHKFSSQGLLLESQT